MLVLFLTGCDQKLIRSKEDVLNRDVPYDNLANIKYLVEKGADVNIKGHNGITPLHCATLHDNLEVVKYLVEKGADVNVKDKNSETPLFNAVSSGNLEVVKYLVEKGADVNVKDLEGKTPLDYADLLDYDNKEEIKEFLRNADGKSGNEIK
ncbi:MAG: ankyrin repeat domain-containing protein [Planctomycetaceae bacterium]|nr:ankyrin repeat domain-containing protein [Planctomycetaceae bacterium]